MMALQLTRPLAVLGVSKSLARDYPPSNNCPTFAISDSRIPEKLHDLDEFVSKLEYFSSHREEIEKMGRNARSLAEERFSRYKLAVEVVELIESVMKA